MTLFLIGLAAVIFVVCFTVMGRLWQRHEYERTARKWEERERLLDRRRLPASAREVIQRRARHRG